MLINTSILLGLTVLVGEVMWLWQRGWALGLAATTALTTGVLLAWGVTNRTHRGS